jgi:hypothetical protein
MIHRASIENFYSIRERQVLDLCIAATPPTCRASGAPWRDRANPPRCCADD